MKKPAFHGVTPILWLVLCLTVWNGVRLWTAIAWRSTLAEFASRPGVVYIGITGAFWFIGGVILAWSLWRGKAWAGILLMIAAVGYTVWYWCDRLIFQMQHANWAFVLALNCILLVYVLFIAGSNLFKREAYEHKSENG